MPESLGPMSNKARVFVVDDERTIADTLAMVLKRSGFNAAALYTGPEAIALWRCDRAMSYSRTS